MRSAGLPKENMRSAGIGEDGRRDNGTQQGMVGGVVVGIVRFQRGEGVRVREPRGWRGGHYSREKREDGMREGVGELC
jgi:hypothetical protein